MAYSKQFGFPIHGNCVNFRNGFCTLIGVAVDPNEPACQNFTPKSVAETPQKAEAYPGTGQLYQLYQPHPPQTGYGLPPPYAYSPWIGYGQGYSTPQYRHGYGYRTRYGSGPNFSASTAPRRGGAGFLSMSSGRRGGGGGGGRGRGRMGGFAAGPGGTCVCPNCGYSTSHAIGTPCYQQTCPKCGSRMTRGS